MQGEIGLKDLFEEFIHIDSTTNQLTFKGRMTSAPVNINIYLNGDEQCYVSEMLTGYIEEFSIFKSRVVVATVYYKPMEMYDKIQIKTRYGDYYIDGSFENLNFRIITSGVTVLEIAKRLDTEIISVYLSEEEDLGILGAFLMIFLCIYSRNTDRY